MRLSATAAAVALALVACSSQHSTLAFLPPKQHLNTHISISTAHHASLLDQLSTLSYDDSFVGKTATKISVAAADYVSGSSSDAVSQAVVDGTASSAASVFDKITTLVESPPIAAAVNFVDTALTAVDTYEAIVDDTLSDSIFGNTWESAKEMFGPIFQTLVHPDLPPSVTILITSYITYSVVSTIILWPTA